MAAKLAPDPDFRARLYQGAAVAMLHSGFFGALVLLDGWFSRRLLHDTERTVMAATTVVVSMFWPFFLVMYLVWIRKSARQRRLEWKTQLAENRRVGRVHQRLQGRRQSG